jgi:extradiol dioxygenase family protein
MRPFHLAFFVRDLATTRRFYGEILGCREGRSTDTWVDFDFFGNQISAHTTGPVTPTHDTGKVEDLLVPMPHFGALLDWGAFNALADRIRQAKHPFVLEPRIRYADQPGEQATMFLLDLSGNALEFKSFRHPEHVFTA